MSNKFENAFNAGITSAKQAEEAIKEIDNVFETLNNAIQTSSKGQIEIKRKQLTYTNKGLLGLSLDPFSVPRLYWAITANNPTLTGGMTKELATWDMDPKGYPCQICWDDNEVFCDDKIALENCLADLLQDATIGRRLYALMNLENQPEKTE